MMAVSSSPCSVPSLLSAMPVSPYKDKSRKSQDGRNEEVGGRYIRGVTGRTASGMVQEMLDLAPPTHHKEDGTLPDSPTFTSAAEVGGFALVSPERTRSSSGLERGSFHPRKMFLGWKKKQENVSFAEERVENGWREEGAEVGEGLEGEGVASSQVGVLKESSSSMSSCTSDDSGVAGLSSSLSSTHLTDRPHPHIQRNGVSQPCMGEGVSPGTHNRHPARPDMKVGVSSPDFAREKQFFTMRPKKKGKQLNKTTSRLFSRKSHKYRCSEAPEITGPAPGPAPLTLIQHEEVECRTLNRQTAVRSKKIPGKPSANEEATPTIQEVAYALEVTTVMVEFKGVEFKGAECAVGCRGQWVEQEAGIWWMWVWH